MEHFEDLSGKTMAELEALSAQYSKQRRIFRKDQLAVQAAISALARKEDLARELARVQGKFPGAQILVPDSVESGSAVGTPGAD